MQRVQQPSPARHPRCGCLQPKEALPDTSRTPATAVLLSHPDPAHLGALPYLAGTRATLPPSVPIFSTLPVHKMGQMYMYDAFLCRQATSGEVAAEVVVVVWRWRHKPGGDVGQCTEAGMRGGRVGSHSGLDHAGTHCPCVPALPLPASPSLPSEILVRGIP